MKTRITLFVIFFHVCNSRCEQQLGTPELPLFYWQSPSFVNFGDYLSLKLVERIVGRSVRVYKKPSREKKLLAVGSILSFAAQHDVVWGSGVNGKVLDPKNYKFTELDVRAVRGPLTYNFLLKFCSIKSPQIYGDPALLLPYFFPEFKRPENPSCEYVIIPHYAEMRLFPKELYPNVVYPTEPWDVVIQKIVASKFVISSSLHGIIVAEAFGIPARWLRVSAKEPVFKYLDYYIGTGRIQVRPAFSIEEALRMGGEAPMRCDLAKLYNAFPFEFWEQVAADMVFSG